VKSTSPKKYPSDVMAVIHETASGLHKVGGMDKKTMREFDVLCLTPIEQMTPRKIRVPRNLCLANKPRTLRGI
jgi:putative transcriptional regulator